MGLFFHQVLMKEEKLMDSADSSFMSKTEFSYYKMYETWL